MRVGISGYYSGKIGALKATSGEIRLVATNSPDQQVHAKILYPTNGTILAMDPDIPVNHQRVQLSAKGCEQIARAMDGNAIGLIPTGGRHRGTMRPAGV